MTRIDPDDLDGSLYRTLAGAVIPRPIAWVSSLSPEGVANLAPYSFFNVVSTAPPVVMFAPTDRSERPEGLSDSARNALDTEEFVVNVVTEPLAEAMNATSATLPPEESEFDHAGLERAASEAVAPPRVAAAEVAFECELYESIDIGSNTMVLGEVVSVYLDEGVTTDGKLDVEKLDAVGRLSGSYYCRTDGRFRMERPE
ncbi:flavin reductase family protein [Halococcus saccharolyticus]|uniref:Flavin reductase like domain protein n=1 Tax=Halococcus saccharolyticus DSM 5350 TaxID=1227455 RepID=M0MP19_9EURY|nr:flavin reductase family protein [Halococcus saccharolyticus]EMA47401.1 Flavin reductase like domain protein [Halococcus saccharolyticus DSM 5350]